MMKENGGGHKEGIEVIGVEELIRRDSDRRYSIIVASNYYNEIHEQLLELGYAAENILIWDNVESLHNQKEYEQFLEKYRVIGENLPIKSHPLEIKRKFEEAGFPVVEYVVNIEDYKSWLKEIDYSQNYPVYAKTFGENLSKKQFQHYVSLELLEISKDTVVLDVASSASVFPEIVNKKYDSVVYKQDIGYKWGLNDYVIGSFASDIPLPDGFIDNITLHCSLEHFEDMEDFNFFKEAYRILKNKGKVCVIPLYMADEYCIMTSPEVWLSKYKVYSKCPKFDERAGIIINNSIKQRQSKHFSVEILKEELLNKKSQLAPTIIYISNYNEIQGAQPFVLILEKDEII